MKLKLTEELWKEGNMYVSYCPELDIASCGETVDQAKKSERSHSDFMLSTVSLYSVFFFRQL